MLKNIWSVNTMDITESEFRNYVRVQVIGRTNMLDMEEVTRRSHLEEAKVREIIHTYEALAEKYPDVIAFYQ